MPVKERPEERQVGRFFESLGYTVSRIPAAPRTRQADFRVWSEAERFIIEVKARGPNQEFARQLKETGQAGSEEPMARTNVISAQVSDAASQLHATDSDDARALRLMAFVARGDDPDLQLDQFKKTTYGIVDLLTAKGTRPLLCRATSSPSRTSIGFPTSSAPSACPRRVPTFTSIRYRPRPDTCVLASYSFGLQVLPPSPTRKQESKAAQVLPPRTPDLQAHQGNEGSDRSVGVTRPRWLALTPF